ncbi:MAG: RNA polymerase sigma factor [Acidimicrobiia bacterium]
MTPNDAARFTSLYQDHRRHVYAYCRRRVYAATVDDVVADVYLTVWRRIDDAPTGEGARPWLYRIAYLVTSNHWRGMLRRKNLDAKLDSMGIASGVSVPDQLILREEVRDALQTLEALSDTDREIIKLSVWEHLSNDEISIVLDIEPNAVRQRLHRARKRLASEHTKRYGSVSPTAQNGGER